MIKKIIKWAIKKLLPGYHLRKNPRRKNEKVTSSYTEGK